MRWLIVCLVGCAAPLPPAPITNHAPPGAPARFELSPVDDAWHLEGSARREAGTLKTDYCCVAAGSARRALPEIAAPGHWTISLSHTNSECTTASVALVATAPQKPLAPSFSIARLTADKHGGAAELGFDVDEPSSLELTIVSEGGLHCCGTTTITGIELTRR